MATRAMPRGRALTPAWAERLHHAALAAIVAAGAILRLTALNRQSLWFDEIDVVVRAQRPFADVLRTFTQTGENGPLYNLLLAIWIRLAGISELAVRFPSAVAGILTIPLLYLVVRELVDPRSGLLAALLLAISPYHIWYSQEAKMYSLLVLFAAASTYCYVKALTTGHPAWWLGWVVVTSLMFYTHVASVLVFVAQVGYALCTARVWSCRKRAWLLCVAALTLPYLPIALWAVRVVGGGVNTWQPDVGLWEAVRILGIKFALNRYDQSLETRAALLYLALATIGLLSVAFKRLPQRWWLLLLGLALVPVVGLWLLSLRQSVFSDRYAIVALPAWLALAGCGLAWLLAGRRFWPVGLIGIFLVLIFAWGPIRDVNRSSTAEKEDWRSAWAEVNRQAQPGDGIIIHPGYIVTTYDYFSQREPGLSSYPIATLPSFQVGWLSDELMAHKLERQLAGSSRVWLVESPDRVPNEDPDGKVAAWLNANGTLIDEREYNGVYVALYALHPSAT